MNDKKIDRGRLFGKIVYIYFCFYSMLVSEQFSMSLLYGAALFFALAALFRMFAFTIKTMVDSLWRKMLKATLIVFFMAATVYILLLNPLLFPYPNGGFAIGIIIVPFVCEALENAFLKQRSQVSDVSKKDIVWTVLPVQALSLLAAALLALPSGSNGVIICTLGMAIGLCMRFFCQYTFRGFERTYTNTHFISDIHSIRSVRLYDGMAITSETALNIFAFTYILYIVLTGTVDFFMDFFIVFNVLALVFSAIYIGTNRVMRTGWVQKLGKNTAFILGTACAIFAIFVFQNSWYEGAVVISIQTVLLLFGLTLQMSAMHGLREDIMLVIRLYNKDVHDGSLQRRTQRLSMWASVISEAVILIVLLILISNPVFHFVDVAKYIKYAPYVGSVVMVIPTLFLLISLVYSIKQPLTKKFGRRLNNYYRLADQGKDNPYMKKRLTRVLIDNTKKRVGVQIIRAFLKPIMYHTVTGKQHVTDLPGIFVFNHREVYGPIAAVVFLPYDIRPWIIDSMIDKEKITAHMYEGTFKKIKWLPVCLRKGLPRFLSPIIVWALSSFDPIPVYRGRTRDIIKTFTQSVECLCAGDSILLFPENPQQGYTAEVSSFYKGFAHIGKLYEKKTGECVVFYPVYASAKRRVISIGEGVQYDPAGGKYERDRIVDALEQRMKTLQSMDE